MMARRPPIARQLLLCIATAAFILPGGRPAPRAPGATFVVTRFDDRNAGACAPGDCSLREAIVAANTAPGHDTVVLAGGTYSLTLAGRGEDFAATGDLDLSAGLTISGTGAALTAIDAGGIDRVVDVTSGTTGVTIQGVTLRQGDSLSDIGGNVMVRAGAALTLTGSAITDGRSTNMAGGLYNAGAAVLDGVLVARNRVDENGIAGGGIINIGQLVLSNSAVLTNTVSYPYDYPPQDVQCGGISNGGTLVITATTIAYNTVYNATYDPATITSATGGGICSGGTLSLTNSTVSRNGAYHSGGPIGMAEGGGLVLGGSTLLNNVTVTANRVETIAGPEHGGGLLPMSGVILENSLIAGNLTSSNAPQTGPDCYGPLTSADYNLIGNTGSCTITGATTHDLYNVDALLGSLADNGGPTWTHALLPGSPALEHANNASCSPVDQRGVPRPQGGVCDIGAFEVRLDFTALLAVVMR